jgi:hypothetical protein
LILRLAQKTRHVHVIDQRLVQLTSGYAFSVRVSEISTTIAPHAKEWLCLLGEGFKISETIAARSLTEWLCLLDEGFER